jgi:acyl carrier protein
MSAHGTAHDLIARALDIGADKVPPEARLDEWKLWDSFSHEQILTELEKTLGRKLDPAEVINIECVEDIDKILRA